MSRGALKRSANRDVFGLESPPSVAASAAKSRNASLAKLDESGGRNTEGAARPMCHIRLYFVRKTKPTNKLSKNSSKGVTTHASHVVALNLRVGPPNMELPP